MPHEHPYSIFPLGDSALTIDFGNFIDENINRQIISFFYQLKASALPFVMDIVPSYSAITVYYDVNGILRHVTDDKTAFETIAEKIEMIYPGNETITTEDTAFEVPVCYSKKFGMDSDELCARNKISMEELVRIHTSKTYRVYMLGFLPGFPYLAEVDERIAISRREEPRLHIPAGSIGIAGRQTGIYPMDSPGGWQIIGRSPMKIFDKDKEKPALFQPGDQIKFYSITEDEFTHY